MRNWIALLILCAGLIGCSAADSNSSGNTGLDRGVDAINAGDFNQAIEILSGQLAKDPSNQEVRVNLASAYAGRAGLSIRSFLGLGQELVETTRQVDRLFENRVAGLMSIIRKNLTDKTQQDTLAVIEQVYMGILRIATLLKQFETVPMLQNPMQYQDVNQAIYILAGDPNIQGGPALYRGLLRTVSLRFRLATEMQMVRPQKCAIDSANMSKFMSAVYQDVRGILVDMALSSLNPAKRASWGVTLQKYDQGAEQVMNQMDNLGKLGVINLNEVANLFNGNCK